MSRAAFATVLAVLLAACAPPPYERSPPPPESRGTPAGGEGTTVVGRVSPSGTLVADTLERVVPDTLRVERETVVTGEIRSQAALESGAADEGVLATGWRVQVFASRAQSDAAAVATRVRSAIGDSDPVYVERDDAWYKVRVGDLVDPVPAERLRDRLAELGWPEAWVVRTTIRTIP